MPQQMILGKLATSVRYESDETIVRYHQTDIVRFTDGYVILNTGGWYTQTTKTRMNQASNQFELGYSVRQIDGIWKVFTSKGSWLSLGFKDDVVKFFR